MEQDVNAPSFTKAEMKLLSDAGVEVKPDGVLFLVKSMFPKATLERIKCQTK